MSKLGKQVSGLFLLRQITTLYFYLCLDVFVVLLTCCFSHENIARCMFFQMNWTAHPNQ